MSIDPLLFCRPRGRAKPRTAFDRLLQSCQQGRITCVEDGRGHALDQVEGGRKTVPRPGGVSLWQNRSEESVQEAERDPRVLAFGQEIFEVEMKLMQVQGRDGGPGPIRRERGRMGNWL
jgi:hypothetical protein